MNTPHIRMRGIIEDGHLQGTINVPVTLRQAVWIEYKRRWIFWKRVKAVHQTITSDNPYVEMKYSECIQVRNITHKEHIAVYNLYFFLIKRIEKYYFKNNYCILQIYYYLDFLICCINSTQDDTTSSLLKATT